MPRELDAEAFGRACVPQQNATETHTLTVDAGTGAVVPKALVSRQPTIQRKVATTTVHASAQHNKSQPRQHHAHGGAASLATCLVRHAGERRKGVQPEGSGHVLAHTHVCIRIIRRCLHEIAHTHVRQIRRITTTRPSRSPRGSSSRRLAGLDAAPLPGDRQVGVRCQVRWHGAGSGAPRVGALSRRRAWEVALQLMSGASWERCRGQWGGAKALAGALATLAWGVSGGDPWQELELELELVPAQRKKVVWQTRHWWSVTPSVWRAGCLLWPLWAG